MSGTATESDYGSIHFKFDNGTEAIVEWWPFGELGDGQGGEFTEESVEGNTSNHALDYLVALAYANVGNQGGPITQPPPKAPPSKEEPTRNRAIALWRLATMLRTNQNVELHVIGEACDRQARQHALQAGIEYNDVTEEIEANDDISAIMD